MKSGKWLFILLVLCLVFSVTPARAFAGQTVSQTADQVQEKTVEKTVFEENSDTLAQAQGEPEEDTLAQAQGEPEETALAQAQEEPEEDALRHAQHPAPYPLRLCSHDPAARSFHNLGKETGKQGDVAKSRFSKVN